jgi:hypothetical protein
VPPDRWTPHVTSETSVDLGQTMVGQRSYFLKLVLHSPSSPDAAFLLLTAREPHPASSALSGHIRQVMAGASS